MEIQKIQETKSRGHGPTHKPLDTFTILFRSSVGRFLNLYNLFNYIDPTIIRGIISIVIRIISQ